jgi:hydroxyacylglutathione hydrolase
MKIAIVACLSDNYSYFLTCDRTGDTAIVDACETVPVLAAARTYTKPPSAIWSTHHHHDHVGGNEEVARALGITDICGYATDRGRIPGQTRFLEEEAFAFGAVRVRTLHIPGHTLGAIAYVVEDDSGRAVFTGDTLFAAGCGRLFEGTPEMMYTSIAKLSALPPDTLVYCGHEYTVNNLRFAKSMEPNNTAIDAAMARAAKIKPTIPTTIADELATNPFVRAKSATELGERRKAKDIFR